MAPANANSSLVRARLAIHHPPSGASRTMGGRIGEVEFQFNPGQLELSRSASWYAQRAVGFDRGAQQEFSGADPASLSVEVFLDASATPTSPQVRKKVEQLLSCCEVDPQSLPTNRPSPPWVRFSWGGFSTVQFTAYVESVSAAYSLFSPTGEPLRATCRLSLKEIPTPVRGQNPTSGALSARRVHQVVVGDTLPALAWREYGNATRWRVIAEANDIDDPMRLRPGSELLLPSADDVRRGPGAGPEPGGTP
ncbi:LysM peptidoglycan-binding domain-containing protein [Streptomyces sp. NPDC091280]|uniref:CIS tube protein n=1 Tax=Streptomyces sp. NPDC091280 TaxID=3365984 RepID=UPI0038088CDE